MKKANNYIDISKLSYKSKTLQIGIIEDWIKQAQEDAIRETVEEFSITQKLKYYAGESGYLDKETILSIADKLIKEL